MNKTFSFRRGPESALLQKPVVHEIRKMALMVGVLKAKQSLNRR